MKVRVFYTTFVGIVESTNLFKGEADVGIVWTTEVTHGKAEGRKIDGVTITEPYNMQHKVGYAIGELKLARNQANGKRYIEYLASDDAQNIYVKIRLR